MEMMSGGFAVGDLNADGYPDLYLTSLDGPDSLYINVQGMRFVEVAGLVGLSDNLRSNGARFVDIDNDGDEDLIVTVLGNAGDPINNRHRLYINYGVLGFHEEGIQRGFSLPTADNLNGWSLAAGDYDRDGWVDLYVCQWHPETTTRSALLRNRGRAAPGTFEDVTDAAGLGAAGLGTAGPGTAGPGSGGVGLWAFGAAFADMDGDGWQDLVISGDFSESRLLWNNGDGTFTDGTAAAGVGTDENGMGCAIADVDGDGDLDWFVSSIFEIVPGCPPGSGCVWSSSGNRLFLNEGKRQFVDATDTFAVRNSDWGWGSTFFDLENDGDLDLIGTNGVEFPQVEALPFHVDRTRIWIHQGVVGKPMLEASALLGVNELGSGKGVAAMDFDRDGDLDVFMTRNSATPVLLENRTDADTAGNWLRVRVQGTRSNRKALGAQVRVFIDGRDQPLYQEVGVGSHFLAQDDTTLHFGLGADVQSILYIQVDFPASGIIRRRIRVRANQEILIVE